MYVTAQDTAMTKQCSSGGKTHTSPVKYFTPQSAKIGIYFITSSEFNAYQM